MSKLDKLRDQTIIVPASFSLLDISSDLSHDEALALVSAIDLVRGDAGFTCELIKQLFTCLRGDLDRQDGKELIRELKQINKEML